jgi:hypothetical protein
MVSVLSKKIYGERGVGVPVAGRSISELEHCVRALSLWNDEKEKGQRQRLRREKEGLKRSGGSWLMEFFGVLRYAQDDS